MADEADRGNDTAELHLQVALYNHRAARPRPTGICPNCLEVPPPGNTYCDGFCQEDHEKRQRAHSQRPIE